jgi:hypothetical protein
MKRYIFKQLAITALAGSLFSCDFAEKNIDPNNSVTIEPGALLTYIQLNTTDVGLGKNTQVGTCMMLVQQASSLNREDMPGDKYFSSESYGIAFNKYYTIFAKNQKDLVSIAEGDDKHTNTLAAGKIFGAYMFNRMTDLFGNMPYTEAARNYSESIFYPVYDTQKDIYDGLIAEIKEALLLFDAEKMPIKGDIIYNGDIAKWKKFGNSLLLRLGMRLSNVDPALAKATIIDALKGEVMSSAADIALIRHIEGQGRTENPLSNAFITNKFIENGSIKIGKTFMDHLKITNDPRIMVYCSLADGNNDPAVQRGMPNGYDPGSLITVEPDYTDLKIYSNFNTKTILSRAAPTIFMSAAESELIQAEAIVRGWIAGDANEHYNAAVTISMKEQVEYGAGGVIAEEKIEAFLDQNLFAKAQTTEEKLSVIGEEFWVATFMSGFESYANWRRLGYPELTPTNFAGSSNAGSIPRRLTYPTKEYTVNKKHIEQAIQQQGPDNLKTTLWWDKQ